MICHFSNEVQFSILLNDITNFHLIIIIKYKFHLGTFWDLYSSTGYFTGSLYRVPYTAVLSITWTAGQNWPFEGFCWALLRKYFCNCYWPFDGPLIIKMQEFTWVGWIEELYACTSTVKCHLVMYIVHCTVSLCTCTVCNCTVCTLYSYRVQWLHLKH